MPKAVALATLASFCTATSSVCQRVAASTAPTGQRFTPKLLLYLVRQPIWLAGVASMILGFVFQVVALHFGSLALVQPIFASELLFVFVYMAIIGSRRVMTKDWMAAGNGGGAIHVLVDRFAFGEEGFTRLQRCGG